MRYLITAESDSAAPFSKIIPIASKTITTIISKISLDEEFFNVCSDFIKSFLLEIKITII